jgi:hypothetical protein
MSSAQVQSLQKLIDFQASLATFSQRVKEALTSNAVEIRRAQEWLQEQLNAWQVEVRRAEEAVFNAKQELARKRMMRFGDRPADTTDQEIALAKARQRLAHAEEKRDATRRWIRDLPEAISEYDGQAVNYQGIVEMDVPRMSAFLDRKLDVLEAYAQVTRSDAPPAGDKS